jgi:microcystin-dependent protein
MAKRSGLTETNHSIRKGEGMEPSGTIKVWSISIIPSGWLELDGSAITQNQYPLLYSIFGGNLPNMVGRTVVGAGTYTDPVSGSITRVLGASNGSEKHRLTTGEIGNPDHGHSLDAITLSNAGEHQHYMFMKNTDPITFTVEQSTVPSLNPSYKAIDEWTFGGSNDYNYSFYGTTTAGVTANAGGSSLSGSHTHTITGTLASSTTSSATNTHNNMQPYLVQKWIVKI